MSRSFAAAGHGWPSAVRPTPLAHPPGRMAWPPAKPPAPSPSPDSRH